MMWNRLVKCPKCGNMVESQPSCCEDYAKIVKCYGTVVKQLKTKVSEKQCGYRGFVYIGKE